MVAFMRERLAQLKGKKVVVFWHDPGVFITPSDDANVTIQHVGSDCFTLSDGTVGSIHHIVKIGSATHQS